jgi:hypothetical protein
MSDRGWQSAEGGQQFYSRIASQFGPNNSSSGSFSDISDYEPNIPGYYNLSVTRQQGFSNVSSPAKFYTTEFNGIIQTFTGLSNIQGVTFGTDVAISNDGNYIAATGNTNAGANQGNLIIYNADGNYNFTLQTSILSPTPSTDYRAPRDFNYDGSILAQSVRGGNKVDIYSRSGNTWTLSSNISPSDGNVPSFGFGESLCYSNNNTLIVGADGNASTPGTVFIFANNIQVDRIFSSISANDDTFGADCSISADGNYLVVGAPETFSTTGNAYVFGNVANTWSQLAVLSPSSSTLTNRAFGIEVAISNNGNTVVVSDSFALNTTANVLQGAVYVYSKDSANNYMQTQEILNPVGNVSRVGNFGSGLAMTLDGKRMIAGDPLRKSGNIDTGAVYLFQSLY